MNSRLKIVLAAILLVAADTGVFLWAKGSSDSSHAKDGVGVQPGLGEVTGSGSSLSASLFPVVEGITPELPQDNPYSWAAAAASDPQRKPANVSSEAGSTGFPRNGNPPIRGERPDFRHPSTAPHGERMPLSGRGVNEWQTGGRGGTGKADGRRTENIAVGAPLTNKSSRDIASSPTDLVESIDFPLVFRLNLSTGNLSVADGLAVATNSSQLSQVRLERLSNGFQLISRSTLPVKVFVEGRLDGTLKVSSGRADLVLVLAGAEIVATDGPAIAFHDVGRSFVVIASNTTNMLVDSAKRSEGNEEKGVLWSQGALVISAQDGNPQANANSGSLTIIGNYRNGLYSEDYIRIRSGMMAIDTDQRDGIRCMTGFVMDGGDLTITATGTQQDNEGRGIKVDGREHSSYQGEGFVLIQDGSLTITSVGKAITASWEAEDDGRTASTKDDPNADVTINGGILDIVTTGIPYERILEAGVTISCSPEGIEAKNSLTINGGVIKVRTSDDSLNAGNALVINGGTMYVESTMNDAIDSNGTLFFSGGVVTAIGALGAETAIDSDSFGFEVNGGLLVGLGGGNISLPSSSSGQHILVVYDQVAQGKTLELRQEDGAVVFSYLVPTSYQVMVISCPGLDAAKKYTVYSDNEPLASAVLGSTGENGSAVTFFGNRPQSGNRWSPF